MIRTVDNRETPPPDAEGVQEMMKQAMSLILAAGLALAGLPAGAEVFGPNSVWGTVPQGVSEAANAVLLDNAGKILVMVPIVDGKFAFRDLGPGQYVVALQSGSGRELARSYSVDLTSGSEQEAIFSRDRVPAAVLPSAAAPPVTTGGGISKTAWILMGAAAVGITTAVVIATTNDNVASPSR